MKFIYTGNSKFPGIYKILNTHTNRTYIGQAKSFQQRWYGHKRSLLVGKHKNRFIQADFNKCKEVLGNDDFLEFHVLEVLEDSTKEERNQREEYWIAQFYEFKLPDGTRVSYNFKERAVNKERSCYSYTPEETRAKKSAKSKAMWASPEFKEATREAIREGTMKPESRELRSRRMKENWQDPEYREKVAAHRQRPELKQAFKMNCPSNVAVEMSRQARKRFYGKVISPTGQVHEVWSLSEFCRVQGWGVNNISNLGRLLQGKYTQLFGWTRVVAESLV